MRMIEWMLVSLLLAGLIAWLSPQQLPVAAYKVALVTTAAWLGYWIDRRAFPYARPDRTSIGIPFAAAMLRRAIIIGAAMLAVSIGL